jgi:membrane protease YdiL (CAAX protease family)
MIPTAWLLRPATGLSPSLTVWAGLIPVQIGACGVSLLVLRAGAGSGVEFRRVLALARGKTPTRALPGRALGLSLLIYPATVLVTALTLAVFMLCFGATPSASPLVELLETRFSLPLFASACAGTILIAPVTEEILFRLVLHDALREAAVPAPAFWSALVFAVLHGVPHQAPGLFLLALLLQRCREADGGSLRLPIAVHIGYNAIGMALLALGLLPGT